MLESSAFATQWHLIHSKGHHGSVDMLLYFKTACSNEETSETFAIQLHA